MDATNLDLLEAARITRHDFGKNFFPLLHDWELFVQHRDFRLDTIKARFGNYVPSPTREAPIPKSSLLSRPAGLPVIEDWILFNAVTASVARKVEPNLIPSDQDVLFSFRWIEKDPVRMVRNKGSGYPEFRKKVWNTSTPLRMRLRLISLPTSNKLI